MRILDPYAGNGNWYKGSFHNHSREGSKCSNTPLKKMLRNFESTLFDFVGISDHNKLTLVKKLYPKFRHKLNLIDCVEYGDSYNAYWQLPNHMVVVNASGCHIDILKHLRGLVRKGLRKKNVLERKVRTEQEVIDIAKAKDGIVIAAHPDWIHTGYHSLSEIISLKNLDGIEIYNALTNTDGPTGVSTTLWDMALHAGKRIWGFGTDDAHKVAEINYAWNMVKARKNTKEEIIKSVRKGRFYVSTGIKFLELGVRGRKIHAKVDDAIVLCFIGRGGNLLYKKESWQHKGPLTADYEVKGNEGYVRVQALKRRVHPYPLAYSQPFFIER